MNKEKISLISISSVIITIIAASAIIALGILLCFSIDSAMPVEVLVFIGFSISVMFLPGLYFFYYLFLAKIIIDFEKKEILYPGVFALKKLPLALIASASSYIINIHNNKGICVSLASGKSIKLGGYLDLIFRNKRTDAIVKQINDIVAAQRVNK